MSAKRLLLIAALAAALVAVWFALRDGASPETPGAAGETPSDVSPRVQTRTGDPSAIADGPPPEAEEGPSEAGAAENASEEGASDAPKELFPERSVWPASKTGIDGAVREIFRDLLGCYQAALSEVPALEGGFAVDFTIGEVDGLGQVVAIEIRDHKNEAFGQIEQLVDSPMEECVMDHMGALQFDPPADGEVVINYPFRFTPG